MCAAGKAIVSVITD